MPKRFVSPKLHGYLDFLTAPLFTVGADVFRVKEYAPASTVPATVLGPVVYFYSLLTDYGDEPRFGSARVIPMKTHLALDVAFALAVGLSPWIGGTWRKGWNYWVPQALTMTTETFFALATKIDE